LVASCVAVRAIETSNARAMARPHIFLHLLDDPRAQPLHSLCVRTALALTTASWRSLSSCPATCTSTRCAALPETPPLPQPCTSRPVHLWLLIQCACFLRSRPSGTTIRL
jgi:hypothetical protein